MIRRLLLLIPVLIGVSILTFVIMRSAGDPVTAYLQNPEKATERQIQAIIEKYHLNEPNYVQYYYWLVGIVQGDWGYSQVTKQKVTDVLGQRFPATFELAIVSTLLAVVIGIAAGTRAAVKANSAFDQGARVVSLVGVSIPVFWLGVLLLALFYYYLGWAPEPGRIDKQFDTVPRYTNFLIIDSILNLNWPMLKNVIAHLILPSITLCFVSTAIIVRIMRSSMLEVLGAEYVRTARSKGLPERVVIKKHARRNALIPTTTVVGLSFGGLLGGAVLTETIYLWPGLGRFAADAALNLDTAGIMGFTMLTAIIYVLANLIVDLTYAYLDPRVRLG
ncbi:MAG: ABC transporter permease [Thermoplasmata archaeon]